MSGEAWGRLKAPEDAWKLPGNVWKLFWGRLDGLLFAWGRLEAPLRTSEAPLGTSGSSLGTSGSSSGDVWNVSW
eukprot:8081321-Karenia_brevis.AAC.1